VDAHDAAEDLRDTPQGRGPTTAKPPRYGMLCGVDLAVRVLVNAVALWVAVVLVGGVDIDARTTAGKIGTLLVVAVIFGLVNAIIRPIALVLSCPLIVLTLGLFALVVNGLLFWLTAAASNGLGAPFRVDGFWAAFWGALVVSIVSWVLSLFVRPERFRRQPA
jgi:putative membrane protein